MPRKAPQERSGTEYPGTLVHCISVVSVDTTGVLGFSLVWAVDNLRTHEYRVLEMNTQRTSGYLPYPDRLYTFVPYRTSLVSRVTVFTAIFCGETLVLTRHFRGELDRAEERLRNAKKVLEPVVAAARSHLLLERPENYTSTCDCSRPSHRWTFDSKNVQNDYGQDGACDCDSGRLPADSMRSGQVLPCGERAAGCCREVRVILGNSLHFLQHQN